MSTEPQPANAAPPRLRRRTRRSRRLRAPQIALFVVLGILAACLAGANLSQPPRVKAVEANGELLVARTDQRAQIRLSQPVSTIASGAVTVTPKTPVEVTSDGGTVTVRFLSMLNTGTEYRIDARVRGTATGAVGSISATFATPDTATYTLLRSEAGDRILEHHLQNATATRTAFEAARIQEYASTPSGLAVITRDETGRAELAIRGRQTGAAASSPAPDDSAEPFRIMTADQLGQLRSEAASDVVGVVASGTGDDRTLYDRALLIIDPATAIVLTVADEAGAAVRVRDWRFVPGTTSLIYQSPSGRLMGWEAAPEPRSFDLGLSGELLGFLPGTTTLAVSTTTGVSLVDMSGVVSGTLDGPPPQAPLEADLTAPTLSPSIPVTHATPAALALSADSTLNRLSIGPRETPEAPATIDLRSTGSPLHNGSLVTGGNVTVSEHGGESGAERTIFAPASPNTRTGRVCLSPNAEFAAIETVSREGAPDDRPVTPGFSHTTTTYVRVATGDTVRSVLGGLSDWCA